ncbi:MAG: hypothetical protein NC217_05275 [Muribaculaceae bacterium]|nr:hypothetical protein [Muribaculaceae bacterium]
MKRTLTLLSLLFVMALIARAEHFDFFGAVMNGPHEEYIQQLASEGITPSSDTSENTPYSMFFDADFNGQPAMIEVCWTPVSDNVFQVNLGFNVSEAGAEEDISNAAAFIRLNYNVTDYKELPDRQIYYIGDNGCIGVSANNGVLVTSFIDLENLQKFDEESR